MVLLKYVIFFFVLLFVVETVLGVFSNIRNVFAFDSNSRLLKPWRAKL